MLAQYANSPTIVNLVNGINEQLNNAQTIEDWFRLVFNLKTAQGYGLDIWGKILNQSRRFKYIDENEQEQEVYLQGAQTIGGVSYTSEQIEEKYRMILFFKSFSYSSNHTISSLNNLLNFFFQEQLNDEKKTVKVIDYGTMVIEVFFNFFVEKLDKAIIMSDLFPHPTGVKVNYRFVPNGEWFGFYEDGKIATEQPFAPFNHKPFYDYEEH